ncbi:uncharacterized protein LOC143063847 isoform X5 [Mytilus galloprovincialis]|uniref:uncharacterized protein LOC143063847 isoform X5 n=1 Tax=Mytilus galloprovincialis TaxID=29158 RepID=UPI003F7C11F7
MEENVTIVAYGELIKNVDPNCELLFQRCWSVSWFNDHNFGWELLKSRATTARDFLPRPQPTAFRVLANATSRLLLTFKTAADARPKALREKFLFFGRCGKKLHRIVRKGVPKKFILQYKWNLTFADPNCELLFQRCWSVSWFNDHNFGWELLKSRATTARDFLPRPQPTAFRVLANATSRLLLTFKTAADARPKALREKFLFFGRCGKKLHRIVRKGVPKKFILQYKWNLTFADPNCELLFQRCWSVSWFNDHNFGWELLKSRATTARDFLPRPQPTAFRVLANATSRLLLTFKTAADARPKALREKFLFFGRCGKKLHRIVRKGVPKKFILQYKWNLTFADPNCELLFQRCWSVSWFNDHNFGWELLKSRATTARDFLPRPQPTAFRVLANATSRLLLTFKTAADARPKALREKFLFFGRCGKKLHRIVRKGVPKKFILQYKWNLTFADLIWVRVPNRP